MEDNIEQEAADVDTINDTIDNEITGGDDLFEFIYREGRLRNPPDIPFRLIVPAYVTEIDRYACYGCATLVEVLFHDIVTIIGYHAFYNCSNLKRVELPEGLLRMEDFAFRGCNSLREITIPASVQFVGQYVFYMSQSLQRVVFTPTTNIVELSRGIFARCSDLHFVELPQNLQSIPESCFDLCTSLTQLQIPASVEQVEECAFYCSGISSIKISEEEEFMPGMIMLPPNLQTIPTCCFYNCKSMIDIRIPASVERVEEDSFRGSSLRSIEIPKKVHHIGLHAWRDCAFLQKVTFYSTNINMANNIFVNCPTLSVIMIAPWLWAKLFASMDEHPEFIFKFFRQYQTQIFDFGNISGRDVEGTLQNNREDFNE